MDIWLHEGLPGAEPGFHPWSLDLLGFATWAPTREQAMTIVPDKLTTYRQWCKRHSFDVPTLGASITVVEERTGDEILFAPDRQAAAPGQIDRTIAYLEAARADLMEVITDAPSAALRWEPSYASFAPWANWWTIEENLAHLANSETHYYTALIGHVTNRAPATRQDDWREYLPDTRREAERFLSELRTATDRARVVEKEHGHGVEAWSVRKVLRRMARHELMHTASMRRIIGEWQTRSPK